MKTLVSILFTLFLASIATGQVIIESTDGTEIATNIDASSPLSKTTFLGLVNTTEQSFQLKSIIAKRDDANLGSQLESYFIINLKAKPSDGIATLFNNGNFNPSTTSSLTYGRSYVFSKPTSTKFTDYFTLKAEYNVNKYTLFNPDTVFSKQISNSTFKGLGISFSYNVFVSGANLFNFSLGYAQKNNYSSLENIEILDYAIQIDSVSSTFRQSGKTVNGKTGTYSEYECFPFRAAYTYCPSEDAADKNKLKIGFSIYYASQFGKTKPIHNLGTVLFLTKANEKTGVRTPTIGLGVQANDINNTLNSSSFLTKRISFNLTTVFNFNSL